MMEEEGLKIECETMEEWRASGRLPERYWKRWKRQFREGAEVDGIKNGLEMINSDRSGILRKANSFPLIASLQHLTQHLQRNSLSPEHSIRVSFCRSGLYNKPFPVL